MRVTHETYLSGTPHSMGSPVDAGVDVGGLFVVLGAEEGNKDSLLDEKREPTIALRLSLDALGEMRESREDMEERDKGCGR